MKSPLQHVFKLFKIMLPALPVATILILNVGKQRSPIIGRTAATVAGLSSAQARGSAGMPISVPSFDAEESATEADRNGGAVWNPTAFEQDSDEGEIWSYSTKDGPDQLPYSLAETSATPGGYEDLEFEGDFPADSFHPAETDLAAQLPSLLDHNFGDTMDSDGWMWALFYSPIFGSGGNGIIETLGPHSPTTNTWPPTNTPPLTDMPPSTDTPPATNTPEPNTAVQLVLGVAAVLSFAWVRQRRASANV